MARIRTIKPEMWDSEKLGQLTVLARLNFIGLISLADDEGRGRGERRYLLGHLHAYSETVSDSDFIQSLSELETAKLVAFYYVGGFRYYALPGWHEHQYIEKPKRSYIPRVPDDHKMYPLFVGDEEGNHSPTDTHVSHSRKGREGKGMDITTANGTPSAVDLSQYRLNIGKYKGVFVANVPLDEAKFLLDRARLSAKDQEALKWWVKTRESEMIKK